MSQTVAIIQPGHTVVTDLGRTRGPALGMPVNGALDQHAARVANALVGNRPDAPLLELTAFDFAARPEVDVLIAVTGARAQFTVDNYAEPQWHPVLVRAGQSFAVTHLHEGLRAYVAVFGSFEVPRLLGSCAPDTVLGFGTQVRAGSRLQLLREVPRVIQPELGAPLFLFDVRRPDMTQPLVVDVVDGPDKADFGETVRRLFTDRFRVGRSSNHVGLRFEGDPPVRQTTGEVLSRGVPVGAVEVPAGTEVLVLHRGRGVTAGYPVLGVVSEPGLDILAQVRPGDLVQFRHSTIDEATAQTRRRRAEVDALAGRVQTAFLALDLFSLAHGDDRWSASGTHVPSTSHHI